MNFEQPPWDLNANFQESSKEQLDQMRQELAAMAKRYQETFVVNSAGQEVLLDLKEKFAHEASWIAGMPFEQVTYMEGQRSVITYLNRILNFKYEPPL